MKEPKYVGPKKGYAAIFLCEPEDSKLNDNYHHKIRIIHSEKIDTYLLGTCKYTYTSLCAFIFNPNNCYIPCWYKPNVSWKQNYRNMREYDLRYGNETIFLGYVKDTE